MMPGLAISTNNDLCLKVSAQFSTPNLKCPSCAKLVIVEVRVNKKYLHNKKGEPVSGSPLAKSIVPNFYPALLLRGLRRCSLLILGFLGIADGTTHSGTDEATHQSTLVALAGLMADDGTCGRANQCPDSGTNCRLFTRLRGTAAHEQHPGRRRQKSLFNLRHVF